VVLCPVVPFATTFERGIHFKKHGHKFGHQTAEEYEKAADTFMFDPKNADTLECVRPNKKRRCRFETVALHFGVAVVGGKVLVTFYPESMGAVRSHGGTNAYFAHQCARNV
jgi:pyocin large subunit-like protein